MCYLIITGSFACGMALSGFPPADTGRSLTCEAAEMRFGTRRATLPLAPRGRYLDGKQIAMEG
jgi:hypothetical protein